MYLNIKLINKHSQELKRFENLSEEDVESQSAPSSPKSMSVDKSFRLNSMGSD